MPEREVKRTLEKEIYGEGLLGEHLGEKRGGELSEKFVVPPFSVLSAREGWWQDRKRAWIALGIQSELGRGDDGTDTMASFKNQDKLNAFQARKAHSLPIKGGAGLASCDTMVPRSAKPAPPLIGTKPVARLALPTIAITIGTERPAASPVRATVQSAPLHVPNSTWTAPALDALPSLQGVKRIAIDTETNDPDLDTLGPGFRRGARVVGCSVGIDGGPRFYLPWGHEGGGNLDPEKAKGWLIYNLAAYSGEVVGAHILYDLDGLASEGVFLPNVKRFLDVGIAEPLLDEHKQGEYNLDAIARHHLGIGKDERCLREAAQAYGFGAKDKDVKRNLWRLPAALVGPYAEGDVDRPLLILPKQLQKLAEEELLEVWDIECRLIPLLLAMRRRGVRVDLEQVDRVRQKLIAQRDQFLAIVKSLAGPQAELMAADSLGPALAQRNLPVPLTPKTQKWSITKDWLNEHADDELAGAIAAGRKVNTVLNTFIDGHILGHQVNGRLHTIFNQLKSDGGGTGARLSSEKPDLQNIPARDEDLAPLMRGMFVPDGDDEWESQDQKQAEYRLLAHYAVGPGADEFRQRYHDDPTTDYHHMCGDLLGWNNSNKYLRKVVKGINFAKGYGAKARKIAKLISIATGKPCSVEKAQEFIDAHERALPFTVATFNMAVRIADRRGYVKSILGRRARFPLWEPADNRRKPVEHRARAYPRPQAEEHYGTALVRADTYTALNNVLQFGNADIMKKAMVDIWESGACAALGAPLLTVHDELAFSKPRTAEGEEAAAHAAHLTEVAVPLRVPFLVDRKSGRSWGDC